MHHTSLATSLRQRLATRGPLSVADYMAWCLTGHDTAYYRQGNPLGAAGDFITAPEISQLFGEMLGVWAMAVWSEMGAPKPFALVELGPGRGTLMQDALRIAAAMPSFLEAAQVHLVEASATLRETQSETLTGVCAPEWHNDVNSLPDAPMIVIANEFFDALPVDQYVFQRGEWRLRMIGLAEDGALNFLPGPAASPPASLFPSEPPAEGSILEHHPDIAPILEQIGRRAEPTGASVAMAVIDYGYAERGYGDTFQAIRAHTYVDPLATPGEADLTAHVNFATLSHAAGCAGMNVWGPTTQSAFLRQLGLEFRLQQLLNVATEGQRETLILGAKRLIDPAQMGTLFKVMAVTSRELRAPPPFVA